MPRSSYPRVVMMYWLLVTISLINLKFSFCSSALFRVRDFRSRCSNDTAIYICINNNANYVVWDIRDQSKSLYSFGLTFRNPVGWKYEERIVNATVIAEVTAINNTYIASMTTLTGINAPFNTIITCNGLEESLRIPFHSRNRFMPPSSIELYLTSNNLFITWNSSWESHFIDISSVSEESHNNFIAYEFFIELNITNVTQIVEIFVCPNNSAAFSIGPCFADESDLELFVNNYTIYSNGSWLVECNKQHKQINMCHENGTWSTELCSYPAKESVNTTSSISMEMIVPSITFIRSNDNTTGLVSNQYSLRLLLISSLVPAGILIIIIIIVPIIFISSKTQRAKDKKLRKEKLASHIVKKESTDDIYSTLFHNEPKLCQNEAYSFVRSNSNKLKELNNEMSSPYYEEIKSVSDNKVKFDQVHCDTQNTEARPVVDVPAISISPETQHKLNMQI